MTGWLADKSALWKLPRSPDYDQWLERMNRGLLFVSLATRLEIAVSARDAEHWPLLKRQMLAPLLDAPTTPRSEHVALEIIEALVTTGLHRSVPLPDVMVASVALVERLTVLHDDRDFERIEEVYGAPEHERLRL